MRLQPTLITRQMCHLLTSRIAREVKEMEGSAPFDVEVFQLGTEVSIFNGHLEKKTLDDLSSEFLEGRADALANEINKIGARRSWRLPFPAAVETCRLTYRGLNLRCVWIDEDHIPMVNPTRSTRYRFDVLVA